jgi:serine/threonine protein kinase
VDDQVSRLAQRLRDHNVSHTDIKHEELFIDEHGELKLLDWGFAMSHSLQKS